MGVAFSPASDGPPWPVPIVLLIVCDAERHLAERRDRPQARFVIAPGEDCRSQAHAAGWIFRADGTVVGPCCAGRR